MGSMLTEYERRFAFPSKMWINWGMEFVSNTTIHFRLHWLGSVRVDQKAISDRDVERLSASKRVFPESRPNRAAAERWLKALIAQYPETDTARKARVSLMKLDELVST